jgi:predicted ATPase
VRVAILGLLEVHGDGGPVAVAGARLRRLIARLALAGGQPVSTTALAEAVWDGAPPADVANALQTLVSRARRALGGAGAVEQSAAGYRLAVAPGDVDALRFERLVAAGDVGEALALWRGPALADVGDLAGPFAHRLEELRLEATVTFLTRELDEGRAAAHAGELGSLAAEHPLHEPLTGVLMRALAATGRQADALAAYAGLRTRLADELGLDPGPPLQAVHLEVLRGEITGAPAPARGARSNLRAPLTSFVGRQHEVAQVRKALNAHRLVTLVGPGGAGKTRLAAEVAAELRDDAAARDAGAAPDGIWLAELASVTDGADVPLAVLAAVGLRESRRLAESAQRMAARDARTRLLDGLAGARALLVLDNCEHLQDRFRLLTGGSRTALPRHRTLGAVVAWSWELLTPAERLLAERFSVFPAGAAPAAVAEVCAVDGGLALADTDELLSSLVDKSLLQPLAGGTRLRMLETIREYGAERVAGRGELGELRRRHAAHYSALMRAAAPALLTRDQLSWLPVVRADRDNILAALRYLCDAGQADDALSLAVSLCVLELLLNNDTEMGEWIGEALAVPGATDTSMRTAAEALHTLTSMMNANPTQYAGLAERLDALDIEQYPMAGILRPVYAMLTHDRARMQRYLDQARTGRNEWLVAASWMAVAALAENDGNLEEMRTAAAAAVDRFRAVGERWGLSGTLRIAGHARMLDGDLDGAVTAFTEAGHLLAELGAQEDLSEVRLRLAELAARQGDLPRARALSAAARAAAEQDGSLIEQGIASSWWAAFEVTWGDPGAARPLQAAAERQLTRFAPGHPARVHMEATVAATSARLAIADGDLPAAREQAARSFRAADAARDMPLVALAAGAAAELACALPGGRPRAQPGRRDQAHRPGRSRRGRSRSGPADVAAQRQREEDHQQPGDPRERPAHLRGDGAAEQQAAHRADQVRERVDVDERLQPAGHRRCLHERVAAKRQREDQQEHHALHGPGGAHGHADPQRHPRERQGEADRQPERRQQQRAGRDAEAEQVAEAHQDDAQQQVAEEVGQHRPHQRHPAGDRQRPEAVEHAVADIGVHVLPDRDAAHCDRLADQAGQQVLQVVVLRAVRDRPAEHVEEQHQEDDRLQRNVDQLLRCAGDLDQVALAEHQCVPQPEPLLHTSASSLSS